MSWYNVICSVANILSVLTLHTATVIFVAVATVNAVSFLFYCCCLCCITDILLSISSCLQKHLLPLIEAFAVDKFSDLVLPLHSNALEMQWIYHLEIRCCYVVSLLLLPFFQGVLYSSLENIMKQVLEEFALEMSHGKLHK